MIVGYRDKIRKFCQTIVVIAVVILFITPGITASIEKEKVRPYPVDGWIMLVENTSGVAGYTGLVINISGIWNESIAGYSIAMYYDSTKIEIVDVTLEGTVSEFEISPGYYEYWELSWMCYDQVDSSYLVAVAYTYDSNLWIPEDEGVLFKLVVNISENANGDTFLDLDHDVGQEHLGCGFSNTAGIAFPPILIDGVLIIEPGIVCGDANYDGITSIADIIYLSKYLFLKGARPLPGVCVGDANADGSVDIADIAYVTLFLFVHGPPPRSCCG